MQRLPGSGTFSHGVHPDEHKEATEGLPIERMPFVSRFVLPLSQHIGAPCRPVVRPNQRVRRGQLVAEPGGFVSTALHSPVTGRVVGIGPRRHPNGQLVQAIEIEADPLDPQDMPDQSFGDPLTMPVPELIDLVQRGGMVGLGGAAFPSHVKYKLPEGRSARWLVLNGCECEPFLTCDHRVMVEHPDRVLRGIQIVGRLLGVEEAVIGVELNKPDAIEALRHAIEDAGDLVVPTRVQGVKVKYPQGAEKMLIKALFDVEVPAGKLPLDVGMVVNNVGTMAAVADWFDHGRPLVERVITVSGPGVRRPANLLVPIGTPIRAVLEYCDALGPDVQEIVMGGPMMGQPVASLDAPVLKGTSGLLVFTESRDQAMRACIKCGRCLEACAYNLNPSRLGRLARAGRIEEMERYHLMDCMECGACTWACPSRIPLVQLFRSAKGNLRKIKAAAK